MLSPHSLAAKFLAEESGATSIEYAIMAAGIALAIISTVQALGTQVKTLFTSVQGAFQ